LIEQRVHGGVVNHITEPTMNTKQIALDAYLALCMKAGSRASAGTTMKKKKARAKSGL